MGVRVGIAGACAVAVLGLAACASDRTVGHVSIINDTGSAVNVGLCNDDACRSGVLHNDGQLLAGHRFRVNVSSVGVPNVYLVRDASTQRVLGCLPLVMPHWTAPLTARVSQAVRCKSTYDEHKQWPPAS